jgi:hypothetical protein
MVPYSQDVIALSLQIATMIAPDPNNAHRRAMSDENDNPVNDGALEELLATLTDDRERISRECKSLKQRVSAWINTLDDGAATLEATLVNASSLLRANDS